MSTRDLPLQDNEHIQHNFKPKWAAWFWPIILTVGLYTPFAWLQRRRISYVITNKRVVKIQKSWAGETTESIRLPEVKRVETSRGLANKILGGGTISVDAGTKNLKLASIPNYNEIEAAIRSGA